MATKKCPYCAEEIPEEGIKCKYCCTWLESASGQLVGRRLMRSGQDRFLAGVCGGMAEFFGMESSVVRVLYALLTFFCGILPGIILYSVLAFCLPVDEGA